MEVFIRVGEVRLTNNFDADDILEVLREKGFAICLLPELADCHRYAIMRPAKFNKQSGDIHIEPFDKA